MLVVKRYQIETLSLGAVVLLLLYPALSSHVGAGTLALVYVAAYQAFHCIGQIGFVGSLLHHLKKFVKFLEEPARLPGSGPPAQLVLLSLLLRSSLVLLEVLEHLLVHASFELLAAVGAARLAIGAELAIQLEVQLLHNLPELKARRPSRRLRLRAWRCGRVELIRRGPPLP